jgi:hypothetical protein
MSLMVESSVRSSRKYPLEGIEPFKAMWISPPSVSIQPCIWIDELEMLNSSIHSSFAEAKVPAQATSLIKIVRGGKGVVPGVGGAVSVGVTVWVGVGDGVPVGVGVCSSVAVRVAVTEGVGVGVDETGGVGVWEEVGSEGTEGLGVG